MKESIENCTTLPPLMFITIHKFCERKTCLMFNLATDDKCLNILFFIFHMVPIAFKSEKIFGYLKENTNILSRIIPHTKVKANYRELWDQNKIKKKKSVSPVLFTYVHWSEVVSLCGCTLIWQSTTNVKNNSIYFTWYRLPLSKWKRTNRIKKKLSYVSKDSYRRSSYHKIQE